MKLALFLFLIQLSLFVYTSTRPYRIAPPGYTYNVIGQNFYYPSMIRQAKDGAWGIMDTHTTKYNVVVYAQLFFVLLGKLAAIFSIDPVMMYQIARVTGGLAVFAATYVFIITILPKTAQSLAVFLSLGMQTGPLLSSLLKPVWAWVPSFDYQELVTRSFGLPHHRWAQALGLLALVLLRKSCQKPTLPRLTGLFLLTAASTTALPPYLFTLAITLLPVLAISLRKHISVFLVFGIGFLLPALFIKYEFAKGLPWSVGLASEKTWWDNAQLTIQYVSSLLPYAPWLLLLPFIRKHHTLTFGLLAWILGPIGYIWVSQFNWFPVANFRLTDGYVYVPAGILSALVIDTFAPLLKRAIVLILIVFSTLLTVVYTRQIFASQENFWSNIYPAKTTWRAVLALDNLNIPRGSGVLVAEYFGEIIPAFANVRVYIGGAHGFPDWPAWQQHTRKFFSGELSDVEALQFLKENDLSYVFYGSDERSFNRTGTLYPGVLSPLYTTETVVVYKVKND